MLSTCQTQITGVKTFWSNSNIGLSCKALFFRKGTHGGFLTGSIGVEGEDHFTEPRVISHDASNEFDVLHTKAGATGCHRGRHSGEMRSHDVGVTLDHYDATGFGNISLGKV